MKSVALAVAAALLVTCGASASLYVQSFDSALHLASDGSLRTVETLTVVFLSAHHGIERSIPISYRTPLGSNVTIDLSIGQVSLDGQAVPVETFRSGRDRVLRIGDPDMTITGTHVYRIEYTASRMLLFGTNDIRLYWNVTGNGWEIPIRSATATLTLPSGIPATDVGTTSYVGFADSTGAGQPAAVDADGRFVFTAGTLNPGAGLTIDVSIPRQLLPLSPPTSTQRALRFLRDNLFALLPIATFLVMLFVWFRFGRDPRKGTIAPAFEPPADLGPGEAGVLFDDRMDLRDVSAMVIGLAVGGYLSIRDDSPESASLADKARAWLGGASTDYTFVRGRRSPDDLSAADRALFDAIFPDSETKETPLSSLENRFYKNLPTIRIRLFDGLISKKLYTQSPERVRQAYAGWGGALIAAGVGVAWAFGSVYAGIALGVSGLVILAFSPIMPRKTQKGTEALVEVLGLSEYIHRAEKDRIEFTDAPEKNPEHFENLLPYAVALGLTSIWVRQFEGLLKEPPQWYSGAPSFNAALFAMSLSHLSNGMQSTFVSAPRAASTGGRSAWGGHSSFGGGFSGGGFGGGGGRGW
jgi:uncharacterized membrane protein YgcG